MVSSRQARPGSYLEVWRLAYPAILTNLSQTIMWTVDSAMVGHVGKVELAAVGLGGIMVWTIQSFFVGLTYSVSTFVSQSYGAGRYRECATYLWQGLYIACVAGAVILVIRAFDPFITGVLGPVADVGALTVTYADIRMLAGPFVIIQFAYSNFFRGIGNTVSPMKVVAAANCVNLAGDFLLIFGIGPFPAMGVAGAAWATTIANVFAAIVFCAISFSAPYRSRFHVHAQYRLALGAVRKLLRIGVPIAFHFLLDMGSFLIFSAYISRMGTEELAANQIIIQILAFSFMPCQGFGIAATTLVGQYIGARSLELARTSAYRALRLGLLLSVVIALMYVLFAEPLVRIFNGDPLVVSFGVRIIFLAALFQFFDAIQMIASGALRGAGDTTVPMLLTVGCAYVLFLPLAYVFGTALHGGVVGAWAGATLYILVLGVAMFLRLHRGRWMSIEI
jgi:MATE family multidrug resistance protein